MAAGYLDGFWETGLKEWDMAAGVLLIKEAGGTVSDFSGQDQYFQSGNIVGGNLSIYNALLEILNKEK